MKKLLAIDVGTTAVKSALFDENLNQLAISIKEYALISTEGGMLELDPETYWVGIRDTIADVLKNSGSVASEIASITCDTQGETFIPVDAEGNALHNAIIWLDSRAGEEAEAIRTEYDEKTFYSHTGLPEINGYLPIAKFRWVRNHLPEIFERTEKFLLLEDYIIKRLTGTFVTNPSIQSSTGYYDVRRNGYWKDMLDSCGVPMEKLPEILPCATVIGKVQKSACRDLGLSENTLVTTGAQDQVAAAVGCGNIHKGIVTDTIGTCQVIAATDDEHFLDEYSNVSVYTHAIPGLYYVLIVNQTAGIIQKWFKNEFCKDLLTEVGENEIYTEMSRLASAEPPLSRGLTLFPYFTGMQGKISNPDVRGCFIGAGLDTTRGCFIRAIMEGISFMSRETLELMKLNPEELISLGGGSKSPVWNQIKADILNRTIKTHTAEEAALLGSSILGAVAIGLYPDFESASQRISVGRTYVPNPARSAVYEKGYQNYLKIARALIPIFE